MRKQAKKLEQIEQLEQSKAKLDAEQKEKVASKAKLQAGVKEINAYFDLYRKSRKESGHAAPQKAAEETKEESKAEQAPVEAPKEDMITVSDHQAAINELKSIHQAELKKTEKEATQKVTLKANNERDAAVTEAIQTTLQLFFVNNAVTVAS